MLEAIERILKYKGMPNETVQAMKHKRRAYTWWEQTKATLQKIEKRRVNIWEKTKRLQPKAFSTMNYVQPLF